MLLALLATTAPALLIRGPGALPSTRTSIVARSFITCAAADPTAKAVRRVVLAAGKFGKPQADAAKEVRESPITYPD